MLYNRCYRRQSAYQHNGENGFVSRPQEMDYFRTQTQRLQHAELPARSNTTQPEKRETYERNCVLQNVRLLARQLILLAGVCENDDCYCFIL